MRRIKSVLILFVVLNFWSFGVCAQGSENTNYRFHEVFFYSFTKYVKWPPSNSSGDFIIGVLGESDIIPLLRKMAEIKKVGTHKIIIKQLTVDDVNQRLNMLFVPKGKSALFPNVHQKIGTKPVLLITESEGLARQGSMINFIDVNGKLRFEVNTDNMQNADLKISQELLRFGVAVN